MNERYNRDYTYSNLICHHRALQSTHCVQPTCYMTVVEVPPDSLLQLTPASSQMKVCNEMESSNVLYISSCIDQVLQFETSRTENTDERLHSLDKHWCRNDAESIHLVGFRCSCSMSCKKIAAHLWASNL